MRPSFSWFRGIAACLLALSGVVGSVAYAHPEHPPGEKSVDIVVDLADRSSGWLEVTAVWHDLDRRELRFRQMGAAGEHTYASVEFEGRNGPIAATQDGPHWDLVDPPEDGPITVKWRVKPGGAGRHGHQGWVQADWASFDGRILLIPQSRRSVRVARLQILRPDGWSVIHPFEEQGEWMVLHDHLNLKSELTATCVAVGDYDVRSKTIGSTDFRVGAPRAWPQEHRDTLAEKSFAEFQWFHDELGYDRQGPFAIAWLPEGPEGKVFGGASVNGACYEHPTENARNWLLLGHRIGHPMNKYTPSGLTLRDDRDHWFMEGWASYIEVVAAAESGILPDQRHWNVLWRRHLRDLAQHPEWNVPLAEELQNGEASEYLHYTKGPMVVKHLDTLVRQRSGVDLETFMKAMWAKYGFHREPFPLREELQRFTGDDYSDFWAVFVDQEGWPFPVWPEMLDERLEGRMKDVPVAYVGDVPIHPEYLFWLAWSGEFERYRDIEAFVIDATHRQAVLESRGLVLLPPTVAALQFALPGEAQEAIARTALAWDVSALPQRSGCMSSPDPARPTIRYTDSPDGRAFQKLLELEAAYEQQVGQMVAHVDVRVNKSQTRRRTRLGVAPHEAFTVQTGWNGTPPRSGFELWAGDQKTMAKQLTMDPSWVNTYVTFEPGERPEGADVLVIKVGPDTQPVLDYPLWQRQAPFARAERAKKKGAPDGDDPDDVEDAEGEAAAPAEPAPTEPSEGQDPR
ncbi:MAG: hypothetical protein R3F61_04030 [Myxococcota bacterium]